MSDIVKLGQKVELSRIAFESTRPSEDEATKLLLGKSEQAELIAEAESWGFFKSAARMLEGTGDDRIEYCGLKVYLVDDESYCEVAK